MQLVKKSTESINHSDAYGHAHSTTHVRKPSLIGSLVHTMPTIQQQNEFPGAKNATSCAAHRLLSGHTMVGLRKQVHTFATPNSIAQLISF